MWAEPLLLLSALTVPRLHREGRVVRLVSDSIMEVNRTIIGHSEGLGAVDERQERGGGRKGRCKRARRGPSWKTDHVWCCPPFAEGSAGEGDLLGNIADIGNGEAMQGHHQCPLLAAVKKEAVIVVAPLLGGKGDLDVQVQTRVEATLGAGGGAHHTDQWENGIRTGGMIEWLTFFK